MNDKTILSLFLISLLLFNTALIFKNPDCPFHVDYVQYTKSIKNYYENKVIEGNVNGKYLYIYLMGIILTPFYLLKLNLYDSLVFITGLFQILIVFLFYKYSKSLLKTILMATTLTFLTFLGHAETVMLASVFLLLYFIHRKKPYSEFFIMLASFIRIDYAIYYLFARKKTALIPISITFLQWFNYKYFVQSDFGLNMFIIDALITLALSFGTYGILFLLLAKPKKWNLDLFSHLFIIFFLLIFLKTPSQKVYFFPVILSFMLYDFDLRRYGRFMKKHIAMFISLLIVINIVFAATIQYQRANLCTARQFNENTPKDSFLGIYQPYLDYYNKENKGPYAYNISQSCDKEYFLAEDWRLSQLLFTPFKFCFINLSLSIP